MDVAVETDENRWRWRSQWPAGQIVGQKGGWWRWELSFALESVALVGVGSNSLQHGA